ncbi:MAG: hypothetical protein HWN67_03260 [Candidatus Helarchaeota archaeon]|nr:hypothetical protein [Candidatus Helarchaeota archaeon]
MFSLYEFEFLGNRLAEYSILKNPLELFGLGIIIVAMIIVAFLAYQMFNSYRETKMAATLYWALAFGFLLIAVIFLIIEKVSYSTLGNRSLGDTMAIFALIFSGAAIVCFDIFSFHTTYPDRVKILTVIVSLIAAIYVGILVYSIILSYPHADVVNYELVYEPKTYIIVYCTLLPIILIAPSIFFYYSSKMRDNNPPNSIRARWMGIGLLFFAIGYITEVAPFLGELAIPFRIFFVLAGITLWICFRMPEWFKSKIGWTE